MDNYIFLEKHWQLCHIFTFSPSIFNVSAHKDWNLKICPMPMPITPQILLHTSQFSSFPKIKQCVVTWLSHTGYSNTACRLMIQLLYLKTSNAGCQKRNDAWSPSSLKYIRLRKQWLHINRKIIEQVWMLGNKKNQKIIVTTFITNRNIMNIICWK